MQDTAEAIAYQDELADALGQRLTLEDEAAIEAELEALVAEDEEPAGALVDRLPDAPTTALPVPEKTREKAAKVAEVAGS